MSSFACALVGLLRKLGKERETGVENVEFAFDGVFVLWEMEIQVN